MSKTNLVASCLLFALAACGGGAEPAGPADPNPTIGDPTFARVYQEVITPNCSCHVSGAGGLVMPDAAAAHAALVDVPATSGGPCDGNTRVVSGDAQASVLYRKLSGTNLCGAAMPMGGAQLSAADLGLVEAWIGAGAVND